MSFHRVSNIGIGLCTILICVSVVASTCGKRESKDYQFLDKVIKANNIRAPPPPTCNLTLPIEVFSFCAECVPLLVNRTGCEFLSEYSKIKQNNTVEICYVPPNNPVCAHEVYVSPSLVPKYLAMGSTLGPCDPDFRYL